MCKVEAKLSRGLRGPTWEGMSEGMEEICIKSILHIMKTSLGNPGPEYRVIQIKLKKRAKNSAMSNVWNKQIR